MIDSNLSSEYVSICPKSAHSDWTATPGTVGESKSRNRESEDQPGFVKDRRKRSADVLSLIVIPDMAAHTPDTPATEASEAAEGKAKVEAKAAEDGKAVVEGNAAAEEDVKGDGKEEGDNLSDEALSRLVPDLADDAEAMESLKELRDLQRGHDEVFEEYLKEKQKLEESFERRFAPFFVERRTVLGKGKLGEFWVRCFENCDILANNITEKDSLAMQYLVDLSCETVTAESVEERDITGGSVPLEVTFCTSSSVRTRSSLTRC